MKTDDPSDDALTALLALHARVDVEVGPLTTRHGPRLRCALGCARCCVDGLTVFEVEAERIRRAFPDVIASGRPGPRGGCAFLDAAGGCRVYAARPYVCRTQGLPLRWYAEDDDDEIVEERDICPLNAEGPALDALDEADCWTLGYVELELQRLQARFGGAGARVALRDLFDADN